MIKILKYELRRRRNTIFVIGGVMLLLAIGSLIITLTGGDAMDGKFSRFGLWQFLTFVSLICVPGVMFLTCSNGHIDELLYKDTNYLMLTIPLKSYKILGGRMIAGLIEFLIYSIISFLFFIIFISLQVFSYSVGYEPVHNYGASFWNIIFTTLKNIFVLNPLPLFYVIFTGLSLFLLIGSAFMFVKALTRSFIRKKMLGEIIAFILFILVFNEVIRLGSYLSYKWNLVQHIQINLLSLDNGLLSVHSQSIPVHLVASIFVLAAGIIFFVASNWLVSKKVEL